MVVRVQINLFWVSEEGQRKREMKLIVASSVLNEVFNTGGVGSSVGRRRRRRGNLVAVMRHPDLARPEDVPVQVLALPTTTARAHILYKRRA